MNEEELFEQFRKSNDQALLEELVRRNLDRIYRFVASMVDNPDAADDIVQDVLLNVVKGIDGFRGKSAFSTWVYKIASNRIRRYWETRQNAPPSVEPEIIELLPDREAPSPETEELKSLLGKAIEELSPALRAAMLLTAVEGLSPEEAATVEGCSAANIHWRIHKARTLLKERLKKHID